MRRGDSRTPKQTSQYCGGIPSAGKLRNDRVAGTGFPYIKIGKSVLYDLDVIDRILEESTRTFTGQSPTRAA